VNTKDLPARAGRLCSSVRQFLIYSTLLLVLTETSAMKKEMELAWT